VKKRLTKQQLLLIGLPVLGLLLGLIGYLAVVSPQSSEANRLGSEIDSVQMQLIAAHQKPVKPAPVQAADIFRLAKAMPDTADMPGILRQLSRVARSSSVSLTSVAPATQIPLTLGYGAVPLTVVVTGKFAEISKFLQLVRQQVSIGRRGRLQANGRLFITNKIAISSTDGLSVSATLNLDAFVYGVATPTAAVGPTGAAGASSGSGG
jgi:Pilus assembly protein, PilO